MVLFESKVIFNIICRQQFVRDDTDVRRVSSSSSVASFKQRTSDVRGYKFQTIDNVEPAKVNKNVFLTVAMSYFKLN